MDPNAKLYEDQGEPLSNPRRYRHLVGKLNYLTITCPDITFAFGVLSQFMKDPCLPHWEAVIQIVRHLKAHLDRGLLYKINGHLQVEAYIDADQVGSPSNRKYAARYCTFLGGNLITWKSKKQTVVARSSAKAKYKAMTHTSCELMWIKHLLEELKFVVKVPMTMHCDNQVAIHIASNLVFHERTKHIKGNCHIT